MAHLGVGRRDIAAEMFEWVQNLRADDGSYFTGMVHPERIHFPADERTSLHRRRRHPGRRRPIRRLPRLHPLLQPPHPPRTNHHRLSPPPAGYRYHRAMGGLPDDSWASSEATRKSMQGNRSRDTKPELAVRSAVHRRGLRYRVAVRPLPELRRTADLVFRKAKIAVFVDGCYWHGCPEHHTQPATNPEYWSAKITGNIARDQDTDAHLQKAGWTVLRFWEHEDPETVADAVERSVRAALRLGNR